MSDNRPPIKPNPPRWKPSSNPASIEVPGLDTSASVSDQIDQIEQLITLKLQNIDENFSKIHTVLTNRILPAVKRYAVATEPVREAAQFWTSFYEQAAQIRIPTTDYSTVHEQTSEREDPDSHMTTDQHVGGQTFDHSISSTGSSFQPEAAFASTPAAQRTAHYDHTAQAESEASWAASLESPLVRLERDIQMFSIDQDDESMDSEMPTVRQEISRSESYSTQEHSRKGKEREQPLLHNVLRQNTYSRDDTQQSPVKSRGKIKAPIPKDLNPYLPPNTNPDQWNGVVDLRDPDVRTPQHGYRYTRKPATPAYDDDDDSLALPAGMSPLRLILPAMPKSAHKPEIKLTRTPNKQVASRIADNLVHGFQSNRYAESSMSTVSSPPSITRYARGGTDTSSNIIGESSMESMMQRVGLATTPGLRLRPRIAAGSQPYAGGPVFSAEGLGVDTYGEPVLGAFRTPGTGLDDEDDDDDWLENEINNTGHPSAAFNLLLSESRSGDDSFESNSSSNSFEDMMEPGEAEPFEGNFQDSMDDDSFDRDVGDEEGEDTLFGLPARRERDPGQDSNNFVLHGDQLFGDVGLTERLDNVAESPSNWQRR